MVWLTKVIWVEGNANWISDPRKAEEIYSIIEKYSKICEIDEMIDISILPTFGIPKDEKRSIRHMLSKDNSAFISIFDEEAEMTRDILVACPTREDLEKFIKELKEKMEVELQREMSLRTALRRFGIGKKV